MLAVPDDTLDRWIREDVPVLDLTTHTLALRGIPGRMTFSTREDIVACGTEEVGRILQKLGASAAPGFHPSGSALSAGDDLITATGPVEALHAAWKVCANILEHASGIATATRHLVDTARTASVGKHPVNVAVTRKGFPGTRELAIKATLAGGAIPHRLGLSESILVFPQHRAFFNSDEAFALRIAELRTRCREKQFIVEAHNPDEALRWAEAGADGIQLDKLPPAKLAETVRKLRELRPDILLLAAGGIHSGNASDYAATGVDVLVTSCVFHAPPADIGVTINPA
ncbi:MAG TPA: ModD protein, partial [Rariglobus sp.]